MSIGLFGGTFDPPHDAHRAACLIAMRRLGLDRVWWLVTPGNPLKDTRGLAPLDGTHRRRQGTRQSSAHRGDRPRSRDRRPLHLRHAVSYLKAHCPGVRFVWIMGADNLRSFHRWQNWRGHRRPRSDRGGRPARPEPLCRRQHRRPCACPLPSAGTTERVRSPGGTPPAWVYLHGLKSPLSSTALRAARRLSQNRRRN